jgi:hypothetical protein
MSPEAYSWDVRESAEELYIIDGRTYTEVAGVTGVSVAQLKRWGTDSSPTWSERRREYRQAQTSVRRGVMLAKAKLIESVIDTEDAQKAYAFASLVSSGKALDEEARERNQVQVNEAVAVSGKTKAISTPAEAATALQLAVQNKINAMLTSPGSLNFAAIKETKAALEMIEQLKNKYAETDPASLVEEVAVQQGLTAEQAAFWRQEVLGVK